MYKIVLSEHVIFQMYNNAIRSSLSVG